MPAMEEFLKKQAMEREKAAKEEAEKQKAGEAQKQGEDALEQAPEASEIEEDTADDEA